VKAVLIIGLILALAILVMAGLLLLSQSRKGSAEEEIRLHGADGTARIISLVDTGSRYNYNPEVIVKMEVRPEKGTPFQAEVRTVIPMVDLPGYQPGTLLRVKYDPGDTSRVVILGR